MKKDNILKSILQLEDSPAVKTTMIAIYINDKPTTTASLNSILNLTKTFENYKTALEDQIATGTVSIIECKDNRGTLRKHFKLNEDALLNLIEIED